MSVDNYTAEHTGHGHGTTHHKIHGLTGWGVILGLPFAIWGAVSAIGGGSAGFLAWLSSPLGAIGFLLFATAAVWYVKLEMDEVIMDYATSGRDKLMLLNKFVAFLIWAALTYSVVKMAFL